MEVKFTRLALADLVRIRAYIGTFNPAASERMAERLLAVTAQLEDYPPLGRSQSDGMRELVVVPPYVLVYQVLKNRIRIIRIWHGAQDRS